MNLRRMIAASERQLLADLRRLEHAEQARRIGRPLRTSPPLPPRPARPLLRCRILGHRPRSYLVLNGRASYFISRCSRCREET